MIRRVKDVNVDELTIVLLSKAGLLPSNCKFTLTRPCCFVSLHLRISSRAVQPADDSFVCLLGCEGDVNEWNDVASRHQRRMIP